MKKIALLVAGTALQTYGKKFENEQELLANVADLVSNVYAAESCVLRTEKAINKDGAEKHNQKLLYTQIFTQEAFNQCEQIAKESLAACLEGDQLQMTLSALRKLARHTPTNVIAKNAKPRIELSKQNAMCCNAKGISGPPESLFFCIAGENRLTYR